MTEEAREPQSGILFAEEGVQRLIQQGFDLWINPEVDRRRASGDLPEGFDLFAAQRLQWPDGRIEVRLNQEVQGIATISAKRPIQAGEEILASDLEGLEEFDLVNEELDAGHWTILRTGDKWFVGFNFLSNRGKCADLLEKAQQFVAAAAEARAQSHPAVVVDTLFSACELIAKAELVASHQIAIDSRTHGRIASQINLWRAMGNVEGAFVDLFNTLGRLRPRYRYDASVSEQMPVSADDMTLINDMIAKVGARVARKVGADSGRR